LQRFREQAAVAGLNRVWVVPRADIDPRFAAHPAGALTPAALHPGYRRAVVLASAGPAFWRAVQAQHRGASGRVPDPAQNPLDTSSERTLEALAAPLRKLDPALVSVYPFRHARQVLGFARLLGGAPWLASAPFGVSVEPQAGPWWALRGALLTALDWPAEAPAGESPCAVCPAPCVSACPAQAVHQRGFAWTACATFRLAQTPCRETCLARLACPVGVDQRYDAAAIAHHYRASLREIAQQQMQQQQQLPPTDFTEDRTSLASDPGSSLDGASTPVAQYQVNTRSLGEAPSKRSKSAPK